MNSFRISLEWSRIEPEKGEWNQGAIDHYKEMIRSMTEKKLIPVVTLNHFTLPLWVLTPPSRFKKIIGQHLLPSPLRDAPLGDPPSSDPYWNSLGGWENYRTVDEFIKYVARVVSDAIGYLHWSLMDNYEWQEGYRPEAKFGLFRIDRSASYGKQQQLKQQPDLTRHITKGAEAFKIIVEESLNQSNVVIANSAILKAKEKFGIVMADGSNITY